MSPPVLTILAGGEIPPAGSPHVALVVGSLLDEQGKSIQVGGAERYARDLTRLLLRLGCQVTIHQFMARSFWEHQRGALTVCGYPWLNDSAISIGTFIEPRLDDADHVLYMAVGFQSAFRPGAMAVHHGIWFDFYGTPHSLKTLQEFTTVQLANAIATLAAIVIVDTNIANVTRAVDPRQSSAKFVYIPNYVDLDEFCAGKSRGHDVIEVLVPRRHCPERGILLMQAIVPGLLAEYPQVRFHFALDRRQQREWKDWRDQQQQRERILTSYLTLGEMPMAYQRADLVVVPSVASEGTSFAVLEAMASELPVVATFVGGLPNLVVDQFNGLLVPPTEKGVRAGIEFYVQYPELRELHGQRGRQMAVAAFSKDRWERSWSDLLCATWGIPAEAAP